MKNESKKFTVLLKDFNSPDGDARREVAERVFAELRRLAGAYFKGERKNHTLQPTALVNEAFIRLMEGEPIVWESRAHFYKMAATMMRRVLVDHARGRRAEKRGGKEIVVSFDERLHRPETETDVLALDEALAKLEALDNRLSQVVELRYFGGLSLEEIATVLEISVGTVKRDWVKARVWLLEALRDAA